MEKASVSDSFGAEIVRATDNINEVVDVGGDAPTPEVVEYKPNLKDLLRPERGVNEAFDAYKGRRKAANNVVKNYIKYGTLFHASRDENGRGVTYVKKG